MGSDDTQVFQNMVLSVRRVISKSPKAQENRQRYRAFGRWANWELAKETDRIWREWWNDAPPTSGSPVGNDSAMSSSPLLPEAAKLSSGLSEASIFGYNPDTFQEEVHSAASCTAKTHFQSLDIGKTIHRATLDLSCCIDAVPIVHEYRWSSVELDVFRVLLAYEARMRNLGVSAVFSTAVMPL